MATTYVQGGRERGREGGREGGKEGGRVPKAFLIRQLRAYVYLTGLHGGRAGEFCTVPFLGFGGEIYFIILLITHS